jgi:hypothetical protein
MRTLLLICILTSLSSCANGTDAPSDQDVDDELGLTIQELISGDVPESPAVQEVILHQSERDRAILRTRDREWLLVWEKAMSSGWREWWVSQNLYGAVPEVLVADFTQDGKDDLFWAIDHEGTVGAMIVLGGDAGPVTLVPDAPACTKPTIRAESSQYLLTVPTPGAYDELDCAEPVVRICIETLEATWPVRYEVGERELRRVDLSSSEHERLSARYRESAAKLDSLIAAGARIPMTEVRAEHCGADIAVRLRSLADSAAALAAR